MNLLVHLAEKILLPQPLTFGGDYPQQYHYGWHFEDVAGLTMTNCFQAGGERGIRATRTTGISGSITMNSLEASTPHVFREIGTCSGALTVSHDATYAPVTDVTNVTVTLVPL